MAQQDMESVVLESREAAELGKTCKRMANDGLMASPERVSERASSAYLSQFLIRDSLNGLPTKVDLHVWTVTTQEE
jgi:hypothetical protein